jgi:hypothetical protein
MPANIPLDAQATGHQPVEPDKGPEQAPKDDPTNPHHKFPEPEDDDFDDAD